METATNCYGVEESERADTSSYCGFIAAPILDAISSANFDSSFYDTILKWICAPNTNALIAGGCFTKKNTIIDVYIFSQLDGARENITKEELLGFLNPAIYPNLISDTQKTLKCCLDQTFSIVRDDGVAVKIWFLDQSVVEYPSLFKFFQLEPARICYKDNEFHLCKWFLTGGDIVAADKCPTEQYLQRYYNRGFSKIQDAGWVIKNGRYETVMVNLNQPNHPACPLSLAQPRSS